MSDNEKSTQTEEPNFRYNAALAQDIENKWQKIWDEKGTFWAANVNGDLKDGKGRNAEGRTAYFAMDMFPYPSGKGLHVGHPLGYLASDVVSRYHRMKGENVLHAMGYDAFGLPAEQYAVQTGQHPRVTTEANIANMSRQLHRMGLSFDNRRTFATIDPGYVRWTQWIFSRIYDSWYDEDATNPSGSKGSARPIAELVAKFESGEKAIPGHESDGKKWADLDQAEQQDILNDFRLAYISKSPVNWCPGLGTVLANMEIYTTRPDTLFGTTFAVVSPEHHLLENVPAEWPADVPEDWKGGYANPVEAVKAYRLAAEAKTAKDRVDEAGEKTGLFTGLYATNPITGAKLPLFTADYVLMDYGTGAIMAVPGGDQRDYDFAVKFGLPVIYTVKPLPESGDDLANYEGKAPFVSHDGIVINSFVEATAAKGDALSLDGLRVDDAIAKVNAWLESAGIGKGTVSYRLRDWLFSRQRYWGEPFPIVYGEDGTPHLLPDSALPINLPDVPDYEPRTFDPMDAESDPEAPLSRNEDWVKVELDLGDGVKTYYRDTNTMPNWAGSCWYYMRYIDPTDTKHMVEKDEFDYWMGPNHNKYSGDEGGVDLYIGGVEHAVLHLLYSRFWHKVLFDLGYVDSAEPFHKLFNQGMIQAYAYTDDRGQYVPADEVVEGEPDASGEPTFTWNGEHANREFGKMGKSLKNIVTPDYMYENYGADTFRLYEMSMGPLDESRPWNTRNVVGGMRFLQRLWRNVVNETTGEVHVSEETPDEKTLKLLNNTIAEVTAEMEGMRPNTAIAKLIVLNNHLTGLKAVPRAAVEPLILMLAPIAPHICEEMWNKLGHADSLSAEPWPVADERYVGHDTVTAVVQIKGKVRAKLEVPVDIDPADLEKQARAAVADRLGGKEPRKVIVKAPKIVSIVPAE